MAKVVDKHHRAAEHILEKIMARQNWSVETRDAIASVIGVECDKAVRRINADYEETKAELRSVRAKLVVKKHGTVKDRTNKRLNA